MPVIVSAGRHVVGGDGGIERGGRSRRLRRDDDIDASPLVDKRMVQRKRAKDAISAGRVRDGSGNVDGGRAVVPVDDDGVGVEATGWLEVGVVVAGVAVGADVAVGLAGGEAEAARDADVSSGGDDSPAMAMRPPAPPPPTPSDISFPRESPPTALACR